MRGREEGVERGGNLFQAQLDEADGGLLLAQGDDEDAVRLPQAPVRPRRLQPGQQGVEEGGRRKVRATLSASFPSESQT